MTILAGDIGGTSTRLALFELNGNLLDPIKSATFPSGDYPNLEAIIAKFRLTHRQSVTHACFGIAGPVKRDRCDATTTFMDAFVAKGRMQSLLKAMPVQVILNDKAALLGAAVAANNPSLV